MIEDPNSKLRSAILECPGGKGYKPKGTYELWRPPLSGAPKEVHDMAELIVKSKVKELVKSFDEGMRVSPEFYDALEEELKVLVEKAVKRAQAEGKKTLYARHV